MTRTLAVSARALGLALVALWALVLTACGGDSGGYGDGVPRTVASTDGPGTPSATSSTFGSATLQSGESFSHTYEEPGTYHCACTLYAEQDSMHAEVVVR
jgi:hypothetical protein